jgi:hypothetical protein
MPPSTSHRCPARVTTSIHSHRQRHQPSPSLISRRGAAGLDSSDLTDILKYALRSARHSRPTGATLPASCLHPIIGLMLPVVPCSQLAYCSTGFIAFPPARRPHLAPPHRHRLLPYRRVTWLPSSAPPTLPALPALNAFEVGPGIAVVAAFDSWIPFMNDSFTNTSTAHCRRPAPLRLRLLMDVNMFNRSSATASKTSSYPP